MWLSSQQVELDRGWCCVLPAARRHHPTSHHTSRHTPRASLAEQACCLEGQHVDGGVCERVGFQAVLQIIISHTTLTFFSQQPGDRWPSTSPPTSLTHLYYSACIIILGLVRCLVSVCGSNTGKTAFHQVQANNSSGTLTSSTILGRASIVHVWELRGCLEPAQKSAPSPSVHTFFSALLCVCRERGLPACNRSLPTHSRQTAAASSSSAAAATA